MSGISQVGSNTRTAVTNTAPGISEADLAKNQKLIESTVDHCIAEIESAVKLLKSLDTSSTSSSSFCGTPARAGDSQQGIAAGGNGCFPSEWPGKYEDYFRPEDRLKVDSGTGTITTPGGYKIDQLGQFEWKISGPDGKSTRVWGDPHVDESDGGKFDFKKNTTFKLPDGTEIHVTTKPWGNSGMTVTGQLDITCGRDRVTVSDIDKGKGKITTGIEKDGYDKQVDFHSKNSDVLHMGKETDDWAFNGREVIGDNNGGESFKLGDLLVHGHKALEDTKTEKWGGSGPVSPVKPEVRDDFLDRISKSLEKLFDLSKETRAFGNNPFRGTDDLARYDKQQHRDGITDAFTDVKQMFRALDEISKLNDMVSRRNFFA